MTQQLYPKEKLLVDYQNIKPTLDALCPAVDGMLNRLLPSRYVVASSHRVKKFDSFFEKSNKTKEKKLKYSDPINQITDLVGFRVIVIAKRNVDEVC